MTSIAIPNETIGRIIDTFEHKRFDALDGLLAETIELRPPTYGKSWHGKALVARLLPLAAQSFDRLSYTDLIHAGDLFVLRFEAVVGGEALSGVDLVRLDGDGRIALFEIFSRPPKVALRLLEIMTDHIRRSEDLLQMMKPVPKDADHAD